MEIEIRSINYNLSFNKLMLDAAFVETNPIKILDGRFSIEEFSHFLKISKNMKYFKFIGTGSNEVKNATFWKGLDLKLEEAILVESFEELHKNVFAISINEKRNLGILSYNKIVLFLIYKYLCKLYDRQLEDEELDEIMTDFIYSNYTILVPYYSPAVLGEVREDIENSNRLVIALERFGYSISSFGDIIKRFSRNTYKNKIKLFSASYNENEKFSEFIIRNSNDLSDFILIPSADEIAEQGFYPSRIINNLLEFNLINKKSKKKPKIVNLNLIIESILENIKDYGQIKSYKVINIYNLEQQSTRIGFEVEYIDGQRERILFSANSDIDEEIMRLNDLSRHITFTTQEGRMILS